VVKTVREQMRYDAPRPVVEAGKPFEVIIENPDAMPHNMVIVEPGRAVGRGIANHGDRAPMQAGRAMFRKRQTRLASVKMLESRGKERRSRGTARAGKGHAVASALFPDTG
jgi:hypothetical protein